MTDGIGPGVKSLSLNLGRLTFLWTGLPFLIEMVFIVKNKDPTPNHLDFNPSVHQIAQ